MIEGSAKKRIFENILSLSVLQGINYLLPLITLPYLVRVLGTQHFGSIIFAQAFIQYFNIITDYGFNLTATRQVAIWRNDPPKIAALFGTVTVIKLGLMLLSLVLLVFVVALVPAFREDWLLYGVSFLTVVGNVLYPVWFFQGMEQMKYITAATMLAKVLVLVGIFAFVQNEADYLLAALLQSLGMVIPGIISLLLLKAVFKLRLYLPSLAEIKEQLKDGWHIFLSSAMGSIVSTSGLFILGLHQSKEVLGAYSAVEKIMRALVGLFAPVTRAVFPFISARFACSPEAGVSALRYIGKYLIGGALAVSLLAVLFAGNMIDLLYGAGLLPYKTVISYLSLWLFLGVVNNLLGCQYLVNSGRAKEYSLAFSLAGLITLVFFLVAIPAQSYYGVLWGMNLGELSLSFMILYFMFRPKRS